jgi:hypothetical protein
MGRSLLSRSSHVLDRLTVIALITWELEKEIAKWCG